MATKQESLPTQQFVDVQSIEKDAIILKNGGLRKILLVSGTNFALKSEEEQGIIVYAFQGFLNSLDFSVQLFIHSRKLNIDDYLKKLEERELLEENELLKNQVTEYREFIKNLVTQNAIMEKRFFIAVPYDPVQIPQVGMDLAEKALGWLKSKTAKTPEQKKSENLEESLEQLEKRVDQVISGLNQTGLRAVPLNNDELLELFYNLYNPATIEKKVELENA
ncbi:MAG: hypothetical protein HYY86_01540 [Candidatus Harrisonbacteria bacterium]|nr:hypothetical protein [Candidatus Harrisonbacteria bacterium]